MHKKTNTILFLIGATIANLILLFVILMVPLLLYMRFLAAYVPNNLTTLIIVVIFIGAILATYGIYNTVMAKIIEKVDMNKYFDPIFHKKSKK